MPVSPIPPSRHLGRLCGFVGVPGCSACDFPAGFAVAFLEALFEFCGCHGRVQGCGRQGAWTVGEFAYGSQQLSGLVWCEASPLVAPFVLDDVDPVVIDVGRGAHQWGW